MLYKSLFDSFLRFVFPDRCCLCRRIGELLCITCQTKFYRYPQLAELPPTALDRMCIALVFYGPIRKVIHQFKYRATKRLALPLAKLMLNELQPLQLSFDAIIAVPLHAERLRQRGFNQAALLAEALADITNIRLLDGLVRMRATNQQARLNKQQRAKNMQGAFVWQGGVVPQRILLVDDVLTTGATMSACAQTLREAGATMIVGSAIARSLPGYVPDRLV